MHQCPEVPHEIIPEEAQDEKAQSKKPSDGDEDELYLDAEDRRHDHEAQAVDHEDQKTADDDQAYVHPAQAGSELDDGRGHPGKQSQQGREPDVLPANQLPQLLQAFWYLHQDFGPLEDPDGDADPQGVPDEQCQEGIQRNPAAQEKVFAAEGKGDKRGEPQDLHRVLRRFFHPVPGRHPYLRKQLDQGLVRNRRRSGGGEEHDKKNPRCHPDET